MMNTFKILIFALSLVSIFSVSSFSLHLEENEELCLDEYFSDKTLVIYEMTTDKPNIHVSLYDSEDKVIQNEVNFK
jgi:hypothetical protein